MKHTRQDLKIMQGWSLDAFVPDYCLPNHSSDLFPLTLAEELPSRQLMLVHSEQLPLSPAAKQFLEYFTA